MPKTVIFKLKRKRNIAGINAIENISVSGAFSRA